MILPTTITAGDQEQEVLMDVASDSPPLTIEEMIDKINKFPSLSHNTLNIILSIDEEHSTLSDLTKKIESDAEMVEVVLKQVNSAHYNIKGGVSSIDPAIMLLGFNTIRNLACLGSIVNYYRSHSRRGYDLKRLMRHSIMVGCCAKVVAKRSGLNSDIAFVVGLLHDIGQFVIAVSLPNELARIVDYKDEHGCYASDAEKAILGIDHAKIGEYLAKKWHFPKVIFEPIGNHHNIFGSGPSLMSDTIHVADVLGHALQSGNTDPIPSLSSLSMKRLALSFHDLSPYFEKIENEYFDMCYSMGFN